MKIKGKNVEWKPVVVNGVAIEGEFEVIVDGKVKVPRGITPTTGIAKATITKEDAESYWKIMPANMPIVLQLPARAG